MKVARGVVGWATIWSVPFLFLWWIGKAAVQQENLPFWWWPLGLPVLLVVGHLLTRHTPFSTEAGIERRKVRVELNKTGFPDRFWLLVMNLFATFVFVQLAALLLRNHLPPLRDLEPRRINWLTTAVQIAFAASLALGAWHRTRWGCKPERFGQTQEPEAPLFGRTAADVGLIICVSLMIVLLAAAVLQFKDTEADWSSLFRSS